MGSNTDVVYYMYIYVEKNFNGGQIWKNILKEIEWNIKMQTKLGSNSELIKIKMIINSKV